MAKNKTAEKMNDAAEGTENVMKNGADAAKMGFEPELFQVSDDELAALWTALYLLDGKFAYAEPLRLALQQISWGRPSPLDSPVQRTIALGITGVAGVVAAEIALLATESTSQS